MTWNYRVMKVADPDEEVLRIHEVYYDENGKVTGWTQDAAIVMTTEGEKGFAWTFRKMKEAVKKPILDFETGLEL